MRIREGSKLFALSAPPKASDGFARLVPYVERYLALVPNSGSYTVDDLYKPKDYDNLHPSSECLMCMRRLYFEKNPKYADQMVEKIDTELQVTFKIGHALHGMIQHWFENMTDIEGLPDLVENEAKVTDEALRVAGSIDSILKFPDVEEPVPIEIKTKTADLFKSLSAPDAAHRLQLGMYLMLTGLPYGILLYISKDRPHSFKEFVVEQMDMGPTLRRWQQVRDALDAGSPSLLPYECECDTSKFKNCPCRGFCRREGVIRGGGIPIWQPPTTMR